MKRNTTINANNFHIADFTKLIFFEIVHFRREMHFSKVPFVLKLQYVKVKKELVNPAEFVGVFKTCISPN